MPGDILGVTAVQTGWVQPPHETGGLDHLGVRAPIIHIYGELLPGITNVTDRARYYTFYPWLIWQLDQYGHRILDKAARTLIRRADCLFTLIGERHANQSSTRDLHALGTVGNSTLGSAAQALRVGQTLELDTYALEDPSPTRYFKNRLGGLGQYYVGSLRDVLLLDGDATSGLRYTRERGLLLAQSLAARVDGTRFWRCVQGGVVTAADLDALHTFCPCQLAEASLERDHLAEVFFSLDDQPRDEAGPIRRQTLRLFLELAMALEKAEKPFEVAQFRGVIYGGTLPGGANWQPRSALESIRQYWATYVSNEILSLGLQGAFYSVLAARLSEPGAFPALHGRALAEWYLSTKAVRSAIKSLSGGTFRDFVAETRESLPPLTAWEDPGHELAMATRIAELGHQTVSETELAEITVTAACLLASLAVRLESAPDPYLQLTFPQGYFEYFPLNLRSFRLAAGGRWRDMGLRDWLVCILDEWGISAHIRVALRKLRNQSQATFQVRPTDHGLLVLGAPTPEFSSPRFRQGRQMLIDIGALVPIGGERFSVSPFGRSLLDRADA